MRRKTVNELSRVYGNQADRDTLIAVLLKRRFSVDNIIEYLLSAIPDRLKDDILGELANTERRNSQPKT